MYGRIFETTYTGSMCGAGAVVFAVWGYVIATMREDKDVGVQVELRPTNLAFYIGETEAEIEAAIEYLCKPDPDSNCEDEDGRRLIPVGKFVYRVVSGPKYMAIRNAEELRAYNREAKRRSRDPAVVKKKKKAPKEAMVKGGGAAERNAVKRYEDGEVDKDGVEIPPNPDETKAKFAKACGLGSGLGTNGPPVEGGFKTPGEGFVGGGIQPGAAG